MRNMNDRRVLDMGKTGENKATPILLPIGDWMSRYDHGMIELLHRRAGEEEPYIVNTYIDGESCVWLVTAADVAKVGVGSAELRFYDGDKIVKSITYVTKTYPSIGADGEAPDPMKGWVHEVVMAKDKIVNMTVTSETLPPGSPAKVEKTVGETVNLHFGIPKGEPYDHSDGGNTVGTGWTKTQAELLKKILQSAVFNSDVSADILILCNSIGTSSDSDTPVTPPEDEPDEPVEVTITQNGNILAISGVAVSTIVQNGNILAIA